MNKAANFFNHLVMTGLVFWLVLMVIAIVFAIVLDWLSKREKPKDPGADTDDGADGDG